MKKISFNIVGYGGPRVEPEDTNIYKLLSKRFDPVVSGNPDFVFSSVATSTALKYKGIRILWTGEMISPDFNLFDYAIAFDNLKYEDRYYRRPLWRDYKDSVEKTRKRKILTLEDICKKKYFASYVYSNAVAAEYRTKLYDVLSTYKKIASGGRYKNNVGGPVSDKCEFQKRSKFVIACENGCHPGYTTEKMIDAFASEAIPIYWGNPNVAKEFNPKSFINCHDFKRIEDILDYIVEIDKNDGKYLEMVNTPPVNWEKFDSDENKFEDWFFHIFEQDYEKAGRRNKSAGSIRYQQRMRRMTEVYEPIMNNIAVPIKNALGKRKRRS